MFKHFYKHLNLFDKLFIVFLIAIGVLSGIVGDWRGVFYMATFLIFVLILNAKDITIKHQSDLIERILEVAEYATQALGGGKIVKTETIEFSVEKSPKKAEGKKPNEKKQRNEDKANAGRSRSRSRSSKKPAGSSKTANAKGAGTNGVPQRKPKAPKKNSKA
jgi:hypothetical protein